MVDGANGLTGQLAVVHVVRASRGELVCVMILSLNFSSTIVLVTPQITECVLSNNVQVRFNIFPLI